MLYYWRCNCGRVWVWRRPSFWWFIRRIRRCRHCGTFPKPYTARPMHPIRPIHRKELR